MGTSSGFSISMIFVALFFWVKLSSSMRVCKPAYCSDLDPEVRFPFRLIGIHEKDCGYPGFDLSCNNKSQTILTLPESGEFLVNRIDYTGQVIYLNDPDFCLPQRIANFNLQGSRFSDASGRNYIFYNCSGGYSGYLTRKVVPLPCLESSNDMFLATSFKLRSDELPPTCKRIENVSMPLELSLAQYWSSTVLSEDIRLIWNEPKCQECEAENMFCGLINDNALDVGCSSPPTNGLSKRTKYGVTIGIGIPALICVIGTACYLYTKLRRNVTRRSNLNSDIFPVGALRSAPSTAITGLDLKTIESYPKLILGESRRFPNNKISDSCCSICLSEYQSKEILRSIPECNHYFHANCIDEWLQLNATCPVCRNMPESMAVTPPVASSPSSNRFSSPV